MPPYSVMYQEDFNLEPSGSRLKTYTSTFFIVTLTPTFRVSRFASAAKSAARGGWARFDPNAF